MLLSLGLDDRKSRFVSFFIFHNLFCGAVDLLELSFHVVQSSLELLGECRMLFIDLSLCETACTENLFTRSGLLDKVRANLCVASFLGYFVFNVAFYKMKSKRLIFPE